MPITLTVIRGPQAGRSFALDGHETFLVGRSASAHFSLPDDPYFSRHHFLVESNPPLCRLSDLDSHNGTSVNGRRVKTAELHDGDEIEAGRTVLCVTFVPAGEPAVGSPAASAAPVVRTGSTLSVAGAGPTGTVASTGVPPLIVAFSGPPAVPGYRDLVELGHGGMGVVYRATRESDGMVVAVKTIHPGAGISPTVTGRFLREARVLQRLSHPRIVSFHEMGEASGLLYFVMDYVPGTNAAKLVSDRGPLPAAEAVGLGVQLCDGLGYAHNHGFVHRDVKPGNLLLSPEGGGRSLRVADFGLARAYQDSPMSGLTVSGDYAGTPAFMAPEQVTDFRGVKPAADQYAAAATVFYLLTGQNPFEGNTPAEVLKKVLAGNPPRADQANADVPTALAAVIRRAMSPKPADRFPDVKAFAEAMRKAVAG
jgi:serine/threonine-protein kinase